MSFFFAPPLSPSSYAHLYSLRKQASTMTQAAIEWLSQHTHRFIRSSNETVFSILSVGCGDGAIDLPLVTLLSKELKKEKRCLDYTGLEPNSLHYQTITKKFEQLSFDTHVHVDIQPIGFCQPNGFTSLKRFDLILMSHVLYYFIDPYAVIRSALTITKPHGHVLIIHQTQKGIPEIQKQIMQTVKGNENELLTAEDIQYRLDETQLAYDYHEVPASLDVSECLKQTDTGIGIMSFCLECDLEQADNRLLNKVHQAFTEHCIQTTDNKSIIQEPIGIYLIQPQESNKQSIDISNDDNDPVSDYRILARYYDWPELIVKNIHQKNRELNILDIACGTGRWFYAFQKYVLTNNTIQKLLKRTPPEHAIRYHFLDPSEVSLKMAYARTGPMLTKGECYISRLQDIQLPFHTSFDIIWAIHGFYNIPRTDLRQSIEKMMGLLSDTGTCVIAQSGRNAFYIDFFDQCCNCLDIPSATSFTAAEDILDVLSEMGISYQIHVIEYNECIDQNKQNDVCHYLFQESINNSFIRENQNKTTCLSDPLDMSMITENKPLDHYIQTCLQDGCYFFPQNVWLIVFG
ncbi:MAG: class I SAM-dependent methyltransferase [Candidatus Magnetomorum sp.]|nr:class I SAM-dependent methyltransferase [Candidatus Magnetomorum sp.]